MNCAVGLANMIYSILFSLGGIVLVLLALFSSLTMVFAIPQGNVGVFLKYTIIIFMCITPIWGILCALGYANSWVFEGKFTRFIWIPLTLIPLGTVFLIETIATQLSK